jgi:hypothetical protein
MASMPPPSMVSLVHIAEGKTDIARTTLAARIFIRNVLMRAKVIVS